MNKNIDRYTFYSADLGSLKSRSFKELLEMNSPEKDQVDKTVADLLIETSSWWIDILAPTNDEMRAISKVKSVHKNNNFII